MSALTPANKHNRDCTVVVEFEKGARVTEISQLLHEINSFTDYKVEVNCIVETTKEINENRRTARELQKQQHEFKEEQEISELQIQGSS